MSEVITGQSASEAIVDDLVTCGLSAEVTREDMQKQVETDSKKEWTSEALLLAAIVNNSGGFMRVKQKQISKVVGVAIQIDPKTKDILIYANGDRKGRS